MLRPRIIPTLLVSRGGLVKTVCFKERKYVGDPINAVKIFNEKEVDEIAVFDIDATVSRASPNYKMIADLAAECRMPLCYGGGIRAPEEARRIISLGVEKVSLSAEAIARPSLISDIASEIGRQSVVVTLDVKKHHLTRNYSVYTHNGTIASNWDLDSLIAKIQECGVGEIVVNSIDRDGQMKGYDLDLAQRVVKAASVPVTFLGGAGSLDDVGTLISTCGVVGAAAGSLFVFKGVYRAVLINYPTWKQKELLVQGALAPEMRKTVGTAKNNLPQFWNI